MSAITLNFDGARPSEGAIDIPFAGSPNNAWLDAFHETSDIWTSETRSQTWGKVQVTALHGGSAYGSGGVIRVDDVDADTEMVNLKAYVSGLVAAADQQVA